MIVRPDSTFPVIIKPYKLDVSQFGEKVRDEMSFTITNVSDKDLTPTLVSWPYHELEVVELPDKIEAGKSAEGHIKIREDKLSESFEKSFTIELNDESKTRFTVPVKRTVKNPNSEQKPKMTIGGEKGAKGH